jgi:hypothetical protein
MVKAKFLLFRQKVLFTIYVLCISSSITAKGNDLMQSSFEKATASSMANYNFSLSSIIFNRGSSYKQPIYFEQDQSQAKFGKPVDDISFMIGPVRVDTPWMHSNSNSYHRLYHNMEYQGTGVKLPLANGISFTTFRTYGMQISKANQVGGRGAKGVMRSLQPNRHGFNYQSMYNQRFNLVPSGEGIFDNLNTRTDGAFASGFQLHGNKNYSGNLWFYKFYDYVDMAYADYEHKLNLMSNTHVKFALQGLSQSAEGADVIGQKANYTSDSFIAGSPGGNAVGAKMELGYDIYLFQLAWNQVFGDSNSFGGGGLVSPHTYSLATDPLYTTSILHGLIEAGSAGSAYKISSGVNLLNSSLMLSAGFASYETMALPVASEMNLKADYLLSASSASSVSIQCAYLQQPTIRDNYIVTLVTLRHKF